MAYKSGAGGRLGGRVPPCEGLVKDAMIPQRRAGQLVPLSIYSQCKAGLGYLFAYLASPYLRKSPRV